MHYFRKIRGLEEWKKAVIVWLRDHNGGKNYDVIEIEIIDLDSSLRFIFAAKISFQKPNFVVLGGSQSQFPEVTSCYYHVTHALQNESTPYSCLNVKELLARDRRDI